MSPEASYNSPLWGPVSNIKLTSTLRPNLLLDAGFSWYYVPWSLDYQPDLAADALPRVDIARSTLTGAPPPSMVRANQERRTWSAVASWLPRWRGEHQVKGGVQFQHAPYGQIFDSLGHGDLVARYRNGVPDSVTVYNTPVATSLDQFELGVFVQDSWTITRRLTLNAGLRYERHVGSLERAVGAGRATSCRRARIPAQSKPRRLEHRRAAPGRGVRRHRRGRTVVKVSASQYTQRQGSAAGRPVQSAAAEHREPDVARRQRRPRCPQLDEIGPGQGALDRGATVRIDPDAGAADGSGRSRPASSTSSPTTSPSPASYFYRDYRDLTAVVNVAVTRRRLHAADNHQPARRHAVHDLQPERGEHRQGRQPAHELGQARSDATTAPR